MLPSLLDLRKVPKVSGKCCAGQSLGLVENWSQIDWNKMQYLMAFGYTPWWVQPTPSTSVISGAHFNSSSLITNSSQEALKNVCLEALRYSPNQYIARTACNGINK